MSAPASSYRWPVGLALALPLAAIAVILVAGFDDDLPTVVGLMIGVPYIVLSAPGWFVPGRGAVWAITITWGLVGWIIGSEIRRRKMLRASGDREP